jgi:CxxC motif-containing protein (DUF1111 family)
MAATRLVLLASILSMRAGAGPVSGEQYPGGGTSIRSAHNLYMMMAPNIPVAHQQQYLVGLAFFRSPWVTAPSSTTARDGLGPLFNARSCVDCHVRGGRARPPQDDESMALAVVLRLGMPGEDTDTRRGASPDPVYGEQLQPRGVLLPGEGTPRVRYDEWTSQYADGMRYRLRKPVYGIDELAYGALQPGTRISARLAQPLFGLGLLEAIPEDDIAALADPDDADGDGVSGRPNRVWDVQRQRFVFGRFGHKAGQPTVLQQTASAFHSDIGITSSLYPTPPCSPGQRDCQRVTYGADPETGVEISDGLLHSVAYMTSAIGVPQRHDWSHPTVLKGKRLFNEIGCASCHTAHFMTAEMPNLPEFSKQNIWPYTDLLLHDMGPGLADGSKEYRAGGREWRTPPLWGAGVTGNTLHDGRARTLAEAILWHGGEAGRSQQAFVKLPADNRLALIRFLESL